LSFIYSFLLLSFSENLIKTGSKHTLAVAAMF
jgi:hypothetical protein